MSPGLKLDQPKCFSSTSPEFSVCVCLQLIHDLPRLYIHKKQRVKIPRVSQSSNLSDFSLEDLHPQAGAESSDMTF